MYFSLDELGSGRQPRAGFFVKHFDKMNIRYSLTGLLGTGLALSGQTACAREATPSAQENARPNILIIYTDDMGVGDVSFLNDGWVETPNIDRLTRNGVVVENYYTAAAVSSPSRAAITTGIFPLELGMNTFLHTRKHNDDCEQNDYLDPAFPSMARAFQAAGYRTAHIGKWHMGGGRDVDDAPQITCYGFDEYLTTYEGPDPDPAITATDWIWSPKDSVKRWQRTEYFVDKSLEFMARNRDRAFFLNLWPDDMHTPYVPNAQVQQEGKTWSMPRNFKAVLAEYDRQIGRLLDGMEALGLDRNTIVVFTSDNGPMPYYERQRTNNLRSMKCSLYEGGIRMPFVVRWPARIPKGKIDRQSVVCSVDLFPSLCTLAGVSTPEGVAFSGEDMSSVLLGTPRARTTDLMWEFGRNDFFYRHPVVENNSPHLAIRRGEMKLLINSFDDRVELYDMRRDPYETRNLAEKYPELVEELRSRVIHWWNNRLPAGNAATPKN